MADSDVPEAIQAAQELADLVSPTASDIWRVLHGYTPEAMAAAVMGSAGGGGGGAVSLLGPYAITYQTADLANPGGDYAAVGPLIPAGTLIFSAWLETTEDWIAETSIDSFIIGLNDFNVLTTPVTAGVAVNATTFPLQNDPDNGPAAFFVRSGSDQLRAAFFTTGNLTAGAGNVYALAVTL